MNLFDLTDRPSEKLFSTPGDPNDIKMGEIVRRFPPQYESSRIVIVGYPQDEGVRRNDGRSGARKAPREIRKALYQMSAPENQASLNIFDMGDTRIEGSLEESHERHSRIVKQIIRDGKRAIVLGGGNDVSYPDCLALSEVNPDLVAINIDSHFDVRAAERRNSGTPYRQLLEEGILQPQKFYELGGKAIVNSPVYQQYLHEKGVHVYLLENLREMGVEVVLKKILKENQTGAIFWGFDMDVVRTSDAPGVSATYPVGLTAEEICRLARIAGADPRSKILEISEVNPEFDIDGRTATLAALVILNFLKAANNVVH